MLLKIKTSPTQRPKSRESFIKVPLNHLETTALGFGERSRHFLCSFSLWCLVFWYLWYSDVFIRCNCQRSHLVSADGITYCFCQSWVCGKWPGTVKNIEYSMTAFIHHWPQLNSSLHTPKTLQDELPVQTQHSKNLNGEW